MKLIIYTDGASRGNPGPASYGLVIREANGRVIARDGQYIGIATNNFAEYSAVLKALKIVFDKFPQGDLDVEFYLDSKLVAEQMSGRFKIKSQNLKPLIDEIKSLEFSIGRVFYNHIPRAKNMEADKLANLALDMELSSMLR